MSADRDDRPAPRLLLRVALTAAVLAAFTLLGLWVLLPPATGRLPAGFDLPRALADVRVIAAEPHPRGSPANDRVREYLLAELRKAGLDPQVQDITISRPVLRLRNILVRIPVTGAAGRTAPAGAAASAPAPTTAAAPPPRAAVLLAAHYDSAPAAPGAADDGAAVAALLETARALARDNAANVPARRDLILLLTDGEELGLLGARAWTGDPVVNPGGAPHPWAAEVAVALNFEARGTSGPSIMFETSPGNLALARTFARADPHPLASSLSYDVYRMMQNDTDFTALRRAGMKGLNFAFIGNYFHYHRPTDSVANLSPRSLAHHGAHALALARHLRRMDDRDFAALAAPQPDAVYFNPLPGRLAVYPATWIWPLTALQLLVAGIAIALAWRRRRLSGRGLFGAVARLLLCVVLVPAAAFGLATWFGPLRQPSAFAPYLAATAALTVLLTFAIALEWRRRTTLADLAAVGLLAWSALGVVVNNFLPGASYLFAWPGLFAAIGLLGCSLLVPPPPLTDPRARDSVPPDGQDPTPAIPARSRSPLAGTVLGIVGLAPAPVLIAPIFVLAATALLPLRIPTQSGWLELQPAVTAGLSLLLVLATWCSMVLVQALFPPRSARAPEVARATSASSP